MFGSIIFSPKYDKMPSSCPSCFFPLKQSEIIVQHSQCTTHYNLHAQNPSSRGHRIPNVATHVPPSLVFFWLLQFLLECKYKIRACRMMAVRNVLRQCQVHNMRNGHEPHCCHRQNYYSNATCCKTDSCSIL